MTLPLPVLQQFLCGSLFFGTPRTIDECQCIDQSRMDSLPNGFVLGSENLVGGSENLIESGVTTTSGTFLCERDVFRCESLALEASVTELSRHFSCLALVAQGQP